MSGIEDRIAAVIAAALKPAEPKPEGVFFVRDAAEAASWLAAAVVAELGLQPEWAIRCGKNVARIGITEENANAKAAMYPESFEAVSRMATEWELS